MARHYISDTQLKEIYKARVPGGPKFESLNSDQIAEFRTFVETRGVLFDHRSGLVGRTSSYSALRSFALTESEDTETETEEDEDENEDEDKDKEEPSEESESEPEKADSEPEEEESDDEAESEKKEDEASDDEASDDEDEEPNAFSHKRKTTPGEHYGSSQKDEEELHQLRDQLQANPRYRDVLMNKAAKILEPWMRREIARWKFSDENIHDFTQDAFHAWMRKGGLEATHDGKPIDNIIGWARMLAKGIAGTKYKDAKRHNRLAPTQHIEAPIGHNKEGEDTTLADVTPEDVPHPDVAQDTKERGKRGEKLIGALNKVLRRDPRRAKEAELFGAMVDTLSQDDQTLADALRWSKHDVRKAKRALKIFMQYSSDPTIRQAERFIRESADIFADFPFLSAIFPGLNVQSASSNKILEIASRFMIQ